MAYTTLQVTMGEGVMTITLARPDVLNAINATMHAELREALQTFEEDADLRCLILTGAGRAFSSGQDLSEPRPTGPDGRIDLSVRLDRDYNPLVERIYRCPKVTIAAVNGAAVGAAANIALACDVVVAARSAYLQEAFARIALIPDAGGTWFLPRIIGPKCALALMLTADPVTAEDAFRMGLIYKLYDDAMFAGKTRELAKRLAQGPAVTFRLIKEALRKSALNDLSSQLAVERDLQRQAGFSDDFLEGLAAFREKRPARFSGR